MLVRSSLALVVVLGVTGCGATSSYRVADSPRVSIVYDHGAKVYKNGKRYKDLLDAVADNPRAREEARAAQSIAVTSSWLVVGGWGLDIAAGTLIGVGAADHDKTLAWAGIGTAGAAMVVEIIAIAVASSAAPHVVDAINIYNDDVEAKMCLKRAAPAPTGTPATPTPETH
jgi:hypothetical protein